MNKGLHAMIIVIIGTFGWGLCFGMIKYVLDMITSNITGYDQLMVDAFSLTLSALVIFMPIALALRGKPDKQMRGY